MVMEETLVVLTTTRLILLPRALCQVKVSIPTSLVMGVVMLEPGPGPWGLWGIQEITNTNEKTQIWLANQTLQRINITGGQVMALVEQVNDAPKGERGHRDNSARDVDGMVQQVAEHFTLQERPERDETARVTMH